MISLLQGKVFSKQKHTLVLLVGGVGYRVFVSPILLHDVLLDASVTLFTYTNVREDALELYGFADADSLRVFEQLVSVNGVGPKTALGVLSIASAREVLRAIHEEDPSLLMKVSGIGRKTAERIIVELRGKVDHHGAGTEPSSGDGDVIDALVGLGYSAKQVRDALQKIGSKEQGMNERIRAALKILSGS